MSKKNNFSRILPKNQAGFSRFAKYFLLFTIPLSLIIIIASIVYTNLNQPEKVIKDEIDLLAKHYYEDIVYKTMLESDEYSGNPAESLEKYQKVGLPRVALRQIFLYDNFVSESVANTISNYCDKDRTYIIIYPTTPYSITDYHTKITYSCNF